MSNSIINTHYELEIIHPATAQWLTENEYTYSHHVRLEHFGYADFIATHRDGHTLIIECKNDCYALSRSITQASDYRQQYDPNAKIAIAVPRYTVTKKAVKLAEIRNALLIALDLPQKQSKVYVDEDLDLHVRLLLSKYDQWGEMGESLIYIMTKLDSPAARKFLMILSQVVAQDMEIEGFKKMVEESTGKPFNIRYTTIPTNKGGYNGS